jgi:surfactin synthase thioesterase subunit
LRLFCFPSAGGGASSFHAWFRGMPPEVHLCPIQLPGRENRLLETPFTRIPPLVSILADVIAPLLDMPFILYGHSMGALIVFELTRELRRRNQPDPERLMVSAQRAPDIRDCGPPVHHLPDREFVAAMCRQYNAIPDFVLADPDVLQVYLPVLRADLEMIQAYTYIPEPPLACPISVFGGLQDPTTAESDLQGWRNHTSSGFSLRMLPGDHFFPRADPPAFSKAFAQELSGPANVR